jgi:hypothetical protein
MNERGLSAIISTVLIIGIGIVLTAVIWGIVDSLVEEKLDESKSCFNIFEKLKINEEYTCYDASENVLNLSIIRGDIEVDSLLIGITGETEGVTKEIFNASEIVSGVFFLGEDIALPETPVELPGKEGGKTYLITGINFEIEEIVIAPKINKNQCEAVDFLSDVFPCV